MERLVVKDKKIHNVSCYVIDGVGLSFEDFTVEEKQSAFMTSWTISTTSGRTYTGENVVDLLATLKDIKKDYNLVTYSSNKKDILVIYTDRCWELSCYLYNYTTDRFPYYFQVLDNIEFRQCWEKDIKKAEDIAKWAKYYIDNLFCEDEYFYITPSQIFRKRIERKCKESGVTLGYDVFPKYYADFEFIKKALFGGICYCPYPNKLFEQPIIEIDLKSAYIYCFLKAHCSSAIKEVDPKYWESYLKNPAKMSIGQYKITYTSWSNKVTCYKNIDGEHCKPTKDGVPYTDTFIMNNTDLYLFLNTINVTGVDCEYLVDFNLDILPKEIIDCVKDAFIEKEHATGEAKKLKKVILNSIYGNCIRNVDSFEEYKERLNKDVLAPQWGILITSYCKELIYGLGSQLDGWLYSDTDSIFCFDTPENREKIKAYNQKIRDDVKYICDLYGYDFEELKNLGTFVIEKQITKFKAWKQKQYVFTTTDGNIEKKAAGCNREVAVDDSIYLRKEVPIGEKILRKFLTDHPSHCEKDGKEYYSETSYYIMKKECLTNEEMIALMALVYYIYGELPY